jgi:hypothetical protein
MNAEYGTVLIYFILEKNYYGILKIILKQELYILHISWVCLTEKSSALKTISYPWKTFFFFTKDWIRQNIIF